MSKNYTYFRKGLSFWDVEVVLKTKRGRTWGGDGQRTWEGVGDFERVWWGVERWEYQSIHSNVFVPPKPPKSQS